MSSTRDTTRIAGSELLQLEEICDRFEEAWREGTCPTTAEYLAGLPDDARRGRLRERLVEELLAVELEYRRRAGELPIVGEYQARYELNAIQAGRLFGVGDAAGKRESRETPDESSRSEGIAALHASLSWERFERREKLGAGAFGVVWRAWDRQLSRDVALKIAHRSLVDAPDKFLREARASARLRHPHIVRVLDAGQCEDELFIVRDYVEGRTLSEVLREGPLPISQSVSWCLQLADALAYTHDAGCIHRDLKPQNVLVDVEGCAFVCDFGLAKSSLSATSQLTRTGDVLGTPAYMSPEQARGESHHADERSDIYSLGVILYQMLTGEVPFRGSYERVLCQVLNDDPPSPAILNQRIPLELATICLKCLEKEPTARYASARELADDLRRFQEGRVVLARPIGSTQRAIRWMRRNPLLATLLGTTVALTLSLIVGAVGAYWRMAQAWREEHLARRHADLARQSAETQSQRAQVEARVSQQVTQFLEALFVTSDPVGQHLAGKPVSLGDRLTARQLLDHAVRRIDTELSEQPRVKARLLGILGDVYRSLGEMEVAEQLLERAEAGLIELANSRASPMLDAELATSALRRARLRQMQGKWSEAHSLYARAFAARQAAAQGRGSDPANADEWTHEQRIDEQLALAEVEFHWGMLWLDQKSPEEARRLLESALARRRAFLASSDRRVTLTRLALVQCNVGSDLTKLNAEDFAQWGEERAAAAATMGWKLLVARQSGDVAAARRTYVQLIDLARQELPAAHPLVALLLGDYAGFLYEQGDFRAAEPVIQEALDVGLALAPRHPRVRDALQRLAHESLLAGRYEQSVEYARRALDAGYEDRVVESQLMNDLTCAYMGWKRWEEANEWSERVWRRRDELPTPAVAWYAYVRARILEQVSKEVDVKEVDLKEVDLSEYDRQALDMARSLDRDSQPPYWQYRMMTIFSRAGEWDTAEQWARAALRRDEEVHPPEHPRIAEKLIAVARCCVRQNRPAEALPLVERALAIQESRLPEGDPRPLETRRLLEQCRAATASPPP